MIPCHRNLLHGAGEEIQNIFDMPNRSTAFLTQEKFDQIKATFSRFNEPWLKSEVEELQAMAAENVPEEDMARQLERTPSSIRLKLKSLGLYEAKPAPQRWSEEDDKLLVELFSAGVPLEELAEKFNRSMRAVIYRLVQHRMNVFDHV